VRAGRRAALAAALAALAAGATGPARAQGMAAPAEVAVLRPLAVVEEPVIRLSDLFDGLGAVGARAVAPAPAPGRRLVLEAAQLLGVARAHGVTWRPLSAADTAVVERPGRALPREEVAELIRAEFGRHGMDPEAELELPGFQAPVVPPSSPPLLALEAASYEAATGRFSAVLVVTAEGMPAGRARIAGRAAPTAAVVVATRRLALGQVVAAGDLRVARQRAERVRPGLAADPSLIVGRALRRPVAEGSGFALVDLALPAVVERGATVTLVMEGPGLSMTAQGRALAAAARGEAVQVMNLASRAVVEGQAVGPGRVRVAFGSAPVGR